MGVKLSPIGNDAPFVDANGNPLTGGELYTYVAGSTTPQTTYTDSTGGTPNANPVVLNSNGYPASGGSVVGVWLTEGQTYKFVLKTSGGTTIWTRDGISGINDTNITQDQWVASGLTPTYVSATSFTLAGDQTSTFTVGRRLKTTNSGGTVYSRISASAYAASTTVTVVNDSGTLDSGLSAVSYGLLTPENTSLPDARVNTFAIADNSDPTKRIAFQASGLTTATTRTMTPPDADTKIGPSVIAAGRNIVSRTNAATPNSKIDITADELLLKDSNSGAFLAASVSVTIDITASGANGLDTGAEAGDTWYYGWVIAKADGTIAGLLSTSSTAPTMPSGYTFKALATAVRNNGSSNFVAYRQAGNEAFYYAGQNALNTNAPATVQQTLSLAAYVPAIATEAFLEMNVSVGAGGGGAVSHDMNWGFVTGNVAFRSRITCQTGLNDGESDHIHMPVISQQIFWYMSNNTNVASETLHIYVNGFKLPVGGE